LLTAQKQRPPERAMVLHRVRKWHPPVPTWFDSTKPSARCPEKEEGTGPCLSLQKRGQEQQ